MNLGIFSKLVQVRMHQLAQRVGVWYVLKTHQATLLSFCLQRKSPGWERGLPKPNTREIEIQNCRTTKLQILLEQMTWLAWKGAAQSQWEGSLRLARLRQVGQFWLWKGLASLNQWVCCECGVASIQWSADNKKGWLCDQRVVKVVSVARQLSSKMIKTMMDSTVWTWMPGNRRTWLHLTSPSGGCCRGQCRKDSTP